MNPFAVLGAAALIAFLALGAVIQVETLADMRDCAATPGTRFDFMDRECWTSDGRRVFIDGNNLL